MPFTAEAVRRLNLMPPELAEFIAQNTEAIVSVLQAAASARSSPTSSAGTYPSSV